MRNGSALVFDLQLWMFLYLSHKPLNNCSVSFEEDKSISIIVFLTPLYITVYRTHELKKQVCTPHITIEILIDICSLSTFLNVGNVNLSIITDNPIELLHNIDITEFLVLKQFSGTHSPGKVP